MQGVNCSGCVNACPMKGTLRVATRGWRAGVIIAGFIA
jgi:hypothetical protein